MENLLLVFVAVLLLATLTAIGLLAWMGHRFLKLKEQEAALKKQSSPDAGESPSSQENSSTSSSVLPAPSAGADILKAIKSRQKQSLYCLDHPDMMAVGQCAISGDSYCEHCLTKQKEVRLAKKYLDYYLDSEWVEVAMVSNQEISQDCAERIIKVKNFLWQEKSLGMIVQGHYKINVQNDEIEAYTVIIAKKDDSDYIRKELSFIH